PAVIQRPTRLPYRRRRRRSRRTGPNACAILEAHSMARALAALYRTFYAGVLSRLPEPTAIALGQAALRLLPLDRLGAFRLDDPRFAVTLGGVPLPNPVILAAQYYD